MLSLSNFVSKTKLDAATAAAIAACDGDDAVKDGVIDDPFHCAYDPKALVGTQVGDEMFTETDAEVIRKIWQGPRRVDGTFLWYGQSRGADLNAMAASRGTPLKPQAFPFSLYWLRYFLTHDPQFDWTTITPAAYQLFWNQ